MAKHLVRVTLEPGVVRKVDDRELLDLGRQGILHSFERTDEAKAILADVPTSNLKAWKDADKKTEIVEAPAAITDPAGSQSADTKGA